MTETTRTNVAYERMPLPKGMKPDGDGWRLVSAGQHVDTWARWVTFVRFEEEAIQ